jgi:hypothetical protein
MSYQAFDQFRHLQFKLLSRVVALKQVHELLALRGSPMSLRIRKFQQASRTLVVASLATLLGAWSPVAVFSQEGLVARQQQPPAQQSAAGQNSITQPLTLSPEVSRVRVGITPGQVQSLALQDGIAQALQNNLDIEQFRQGVQISERSLYASKGVYDILSTSDVNYRSTTQPIVSIFGGGGASSSLTQRSLNYNFTTSQLVERTGGYWEADFLNSRTVTSSTAFNAQFRD